MPAPAGVGEKLSLPDRSRQQNPEMFEEMETSSTQQQPNLFTRNIIPTCLSGDPRFYQQQLLTMQGKEKAPKTIEELDWADSTELQPNSFQSEDDQQTENDPFSIEMCTFILLKHPPEMPFMFTLVLALFESEFNGNISVSDHMDVLSPDFRNWAKEQTEQLGFSVFITNNVNIRIRVEPLHQKNINNKKSYHSPRKHSLPSPDHSPKRKRISRQPLHDPSDNFPLPLHASPSKLREIFESQTNAPIKQLYDKVNRLLSNLKSINSFSLDTLDLEKYNFGHYSKKYKGKTKQYAFAIVYMDGGGLTEISPGAEPRHRKSNPAASGERTLHSEEIVIKELDIFLCQKKTKVQSILIYTYYSPCLRRGKCCPCMFLLVDKAHQWYHEYGIVTKACFTKFWGLNNPDFFKDIDYSWLSNPDRTISRYKRTPLYLDDKSLKLYSRRVIEKKKPGIRSELKKLVEDARLESRSIEEHIKLGERLIDAMKFKEKIYKELEKEKKYQELERQKKFEESEKQGLKKSWRTMVENSLIPQIREKINFDFNIAVVTLFQKVLKELYQDTSPFELFQIPTNMLKGL